MLLFATAFMVWLWPLSAHALYRVNATPLWPDGHVPVCWEIGRASDGTGDPVPARAHPNFANLSRVIRDAVDNGWGRVANIHFVGWYDCASTSPNGNPGMIAIHWEPGVGDFAAIGYNSGSWTRIRFDPNRLVSNEAIFRGYVLHEFGHALGFNHDMDRPDWVIPASGCRGNPVSDANYYTNFYQTPPDPASITNFSYCLGQSHGTLSPWDIVGVQNAYGTKRSGSLVGLSNRCLDVPNANTFAPGILMQVFGCTGAFNQQWQWRTDYSLFVNSPLPPPLLNLDVVGASTVPGTSTQLYWRGTPALANQQWRFEGVQIKGIGNKCLDIPGARFAPAANVQMYDCNGGINQKWTVEPDGQIKAAGGGGNLCLDVPGGVTTPGTALQLFPCHSGITQRFTFTDVGEIKFGGSCLDVRSGTVANGNVIQLYGCRGNVAHQRWHLTGPVHGLGGQCLDIRGGRGVNNAAVQIYPCSPDAANQEWDYYVRQR